jgi:FkbH-like protein
MPDALRCIVMADFNAANLVSYLGADSSRPTLNAEPRMVADLQTAREDAEISSEPAQILLVWFRPERVSASLASALDGKAFDVVSALADVDRFGDSLERLARRAGTVFVASWVMPPHHRGFGMSALKPRVGPSHLVLQMNLRLLDRVAPIENIHVLDAASWIAEGGAHAFNERLWYMGKIPYANDVFRRAARDVKAALRGIGGEAKKIIVVDLDNTLWGGVVGEAGWQALRLGGHDPVGEAYVDFQRALKALANRGVLLAIVSKNDEPVALEAVREHPEMVLRETDFAGRRINWQDKAQNIADLLADLNLGLESAVFIDDHPVERARVRHSLPEVFVPEWPSSPLLYPRALLSLDCFDTPALTLEDRGRGELYRAEEQRDATRREVGSLDDWLRTLSLSVRVAELNDADCPRATQLLNKTNQMNLATRRLSSGQLREWAARTDCSVWTFRVADRFGDVGLTGILSLQFDGDEARVVDFVVSCRVIGRCVEETMLHHAVEQARAAGRRRLIAEYAPTQRNTPCKRFLERSGLSNGDGRTYWWDAVNPYPAPKHVAFEVKVDA